MPVAERNTSLETQSQDSSLQISSPIDNSAKELFPSDLELLEGLPPEEVHRRALEARKALGHAQRALCFWLLEIEKRKLYHYFGCSSVFHYCEIYLELAPHTIAEFLRTGKELEKLPRLAQAVAKGQVAPSKVREISRVATPETEEFWMNVASGSTYRQVEKLVSLTPKGGLPPVVSKTETGSVGAGENKENCGVPVRIDETGESKAGPSKYRSKLVIELENDQMAVIAKAFEKARKETGLRGKGELIEYIAGVFLERESDLQFGCKSSYRITLYHIPEANLTWTEGTSGALYVTQSTLEQAMCDSEIVDLRENSTYAEKSDGVSSAYSESEALANKGVDPVRDASGEEKFPPDSKQKSPPEDSDFHESSVPRLRRTIPLTLKRKVLERDGNRCTSPGCINRKFLEVHHLKPVRLGGKNTASNCTTICWKCHKAVHEGRLIVEGRAPSQLVWKNGKGEVLKGSPDNPLPR